MNTQYQSVWTYAEDLLWALIVSAARGLSSHIKIEYVQFKHEKAMNLISSPSPSTYILT